MAFNWCTAEMELLKLNKIDSHIMCISSSTEGSNPESYNTLKNNENFDRRKKSVFESDQNGKHPKNSHFFSKPPKIVKFKILTPKDSPSLCIEQISEYPSPTLWEVSIHPNYCINLYFIRQFRVSQQIVAYCHTRNLVRWPVTVGFTFPFIRIELGTRSFMSAHDYIFPIVSLLVTARFVSEFIESI